LDVWTAAIAENRGRDYALGRKWDDLRSRENGKKPRLLPARSVTLRNCCAVPINF